jgi:hypothetical protein
MSLTERRPGDSPNRSAIRVGWGYRQPMIGDLVQTTAGKWVVVAPTHCRNGHRLGPSQCLVGHTACRGHGGGHITWTCRTCDATAYGVPLGKHCKAVSGPADVRISNIRRPDEPPSELPPLPALR